MGHRITKREKHLKLKARLAREDYCPQPFSSSVNPIQSAALVRGLCKTGQQLNKHKYNLLRAELKKEMKND